MTTLTGGLPQAFASAGVLGPAGGAKAQTQLLKDLYAMPAELGSLLSSWEPPAGTSPRGFMVHIQDAHANPEAQQNISEILRFLAKKYPDLVIGVEGASGPLHPEYLQFFREFPEAGRAVVKDLRQKGELGGAELFAWDQSLEQQRSAQDLPGRGVEKTKRGNDVIPVRGVENAELYRENLKTYQELLFTRDEIQTCLNPLRAKLETEISKNLNGDLRDFLNERNRRKEGKYTPDRASGDPDLQAYVLYLKKEALKFLQIDLKDPLEQLRFPNLVRIILSGKVQKGLDDAKVREDWKNVLAALKAAATGNADLEFVHALSFFGLKKCFLTEPQDGASVPTVMDAALYPRKLLEQLFLFAKKHSLSFEGHRPFLKSLEQVIFQAEIEAAGLLQEMNSLEMLLTEKLSKNDAEKKLVRRLQSFRLLEKLLSLELTREEYEQIEAEQGSLEAFVEGTPALRNFLGRAKHFYVTALQRDRALMENALALGAESKEQKKVVVLITGGFHTGGIDALLREQGIRYVTLTPHISQTDRGELYQKVMAGDHADLSAYFNSKNPFRTKQEALLFKELVETSAPALFEKYRMEPAAIASAVASAVKDHPVLSTAVKAVSADEANPAALRFIPKTMTPQSMAIANPAITAEPAFQNAISVELGETAPTAAIVRFGIAEALTLSIQQARSELRQGRVRPEYQITLKKITDKGQEPKLWEAIREKDGLLNRFETQEVTAAGLQEEPLQEAARLYLQLFPSLDSQQAEKEILSKNYRNVLILNRGKVVGLYSFLGSHLDGVVVDEHYQGTGAVDVLFEDAVERLAHGDRGRKFSAVILRDPSKALKQGEIHGTLDEIKRLMGITSVVALKPAGAKANAAASRSEGRLLKDAEELSREAQLPWSELVRQVWFTAAHDLSAEPSGWKEILSFPNLVSAHRIPLLTAAEFDKEPLSRQIAIAVRYEKYLSQLDQEIQQKINSAIPKPYRDVLDYVVENVLQHVDARSNAAAYGTLWKHPGTNDLWFYLFESGNGFDVEAVMKDPKKFHNILTGAHGEALSNLKKGYYFEHDPVVMGSVYMELRKSWMLRSQGKEFNSPEGRFREAATPDRGTMFVMRIAAEDLTPGNVEGQRLPPARSEARFEANIDILAGNATVWDAYEVLEGRPGDGAALEAIAKEIVTVLGAAKVRAFSFNERKDLLNGLTTRLQEQEFITAGWDKAQLQELSKTVRRYALQVAEAEAAARTGEGQRSEVRRAEVPLRSTTERELRLTNGQIIRIERERVIPVDEFVRGPRLGLKQVLENIFSTSKVLPVSGTLRPYSSFDPFIRLDLRGLDVALKDGSPVEEIRVFRATIGLPSSPGYADYHYVPSEKTILCSVTEALKPVIQSRADGSRVEALIGTSTLPAEEPNPPEFWSVWHHSRVYDQYRESVDPVLLEAVASVLSLPGYRNKTDMAYLDLFGGDGSFMAKVLAYKDTLPGKTHWIPYLIDRDTASLNAARDRLDAMPVRVYRSDLVFGEKLSEIVQHKLDLVTSEGGINAGVVDTETAARVSREVFDALNPGGYFLVTGYTLSRLSAKDFASIGFEVINASVPPNLLSESVPKQLYVLRKPLTSSAVRPVASETGERQPSSVRSEMREEETGQQASSVRGSFGPRAKALRKMTRERPYWAGQQKYAAETEKKNNAALGHALKEVFAPSDHAAIAPLKDPGLLAFDGADFLKRFLDHIWTLEDLAYYMGYAKENTAIRSGFHNDAFYEKHLGRYAVLLGETLRRGTTGSRSVTREARQSLSFLVSREADFDWEANAETLPDLKGLTIPLDSRGRMSLTIGASQYLPFMLGFADSGWEMVILEAGVRDGAYLFHVEFRKQGRETFPKTFQVGPHRRPLEARVGAKSGEPDTVFEVLERPGLYTLSEIVMKPSDYDWVQNPDKVRSFKRILLGKPTPVKGDFVFYPVPGDASYAYTLSFKPYADRTGYLIDGGVKDGVYQFGISLEKSGAEPKIFYFQVSPESKMLKSNLGRPNVEVRMLSQRAVLRPLSRIIEAIGSKTEVNVQDVARLPGLKVGLLNGYGAVRFYIHNYIYTWSVLGSYPKPGEKWTATVIAADRVNGWVQCVVRLEEGKDTFYKAFQIGPMVRWVPGAKDQAGRRKAMPIMIDLETVESFSVFGNPVLQAGWVDGKRGLVKTEIDPYWYTYRREFYKRLTDILNSLDQGTEREIADKILGGETNELITHSMNVSVDLVNTVREKLKQGMAGFNPERNHRQKEGDTEGKRSEVRAEPVAAESSPRDFFWAIQQDSNGRVKKELAGHPLLVEDPAESLEKWLRTYQTFLFDVDETLHHTSLYIENAHREALVFALQQMAEYGIPPIKGNALSERILSEIDLRDAVRAGGWEVTPDVLTRYQKLYFDKEQDLIDSNPSALVRGARHFLNRIQEKERHIAIISSSPEALGYLNRGSLKISMPPDTQGIPFYIGTVGDKEKEFRTEMSKREGPGILFDDNVNELKNGRRLGLVTVAVLGPIFSLPEPEDALSKEKFKRDKNELLNALIAQCDFVIWDFDNPKIYRVRRDLIAGGDALMKTSAAVTKTDEARSEARGGTLLADEVTVLLDRVEQIIEEELARVGMSSGVAPTSAGIYKPTPLHEIWARLQSLGIGPGKRVVDLGSGDGRVVLLAALMGARAVGFEHDPKLIQVGLAVQSRLAGEMDLAPAVFVEGDFFDPAVRQDHLKTADLIFYFWTGAMPRATTTQGLWTANQDVVQLLRREVKPTGQVLLYDYDSSRHGMPFPGWDVVPLDGRVAWNDRAYRRVNDEKPSEPRDLRTIVSALWTVGDLLGRYLFLKKRPVAGSQGSRQAVRETEGRQPFSVRSEVRGGGRVATARLQRIDRGFQEYQDSFDSGETDFFLTEVQPVSVVRFQKIVKWLNVFNIPKSVLNLFLRGALIFILVAISGNPVIAIPGGIIRAALVFLFHSGGDLVSRPPRKIDLEKKKFQKRVLEAMRKRMNEASSLEEKRKLAQTPRFFGGYYFLAEYVLNELEKIPTSTQFFATDDHPSLREQLVDVFGACVDQIIRWKSTGAQHQKDWALLTRLFEFLTDPDQRVVVAAVRWLGQIESKIDDVTRNEIEKKYFEIATSQSSEVSRGAVVRGLRFIRTPKSFERMLEIIESDPSPWVQTYATEVIQFLLESGQYDARAVQYFYGPRLIRVLMKKASGEEGGKSSYIMRRVGSLKALAFLSWYEPNVVNNFRDILLHDTNAAVQEVALWALARAYAEYPQLSEGVDDLLKALLLYMEGKHEGQHNFLLANYARRLLGEFSRDAFNPLLKQKAIAASLERESAPQDGEDTPVILVAMDPLVPTTGPDAQKGAESDKVFDVVKIGQERGWTVLMAPRYRVDRDKAKAQNHFLSGTNLDLPRLVHAVNRLRKLLPIRVPSRDDKRNKADRHSTSPVIPKKGGPIVIFVNARELYEISLQISNLSPQIVLLQDHPELFHQRWRGMTVVKKYDPQDLIDLVEAAASQARQQATKAGTQLAAREIEEQRPSSVRSESREGEGLAAQRSPEERFRRFFGASSDRLLRWLASRASQPISSYEIRSERITDLWVYRRIVEKHTLRMGENTFTWFTKRYEGASLLRKFFLSWIRHEAIVTRHAFRLGLSPRTFMVVDRDNYFLTLISQTGHPLSEPINEVKAAAVGNALGRLHRGGVIHGDVVERINALIPRLEHFYVDQGTVRFIDFGEGKIGITSRNGFWERLRFALARKLEASKLGRALAHQAEDSIKDRVLQAYSRAYKEAYLGHVPAGGHQAESQRSEIREGAALSNPLKGSSPFHIGWNMYRWASYDREVAESLGIRLTTRATGLYYFLIELFGIKPEEAHAKGFDRLFWLWSQYMMVGDDLLDRFGKRLSVDEITEMLAEVDRTHKIDLRLRSRVAEAELRAAPISAVFPSDPRDGIQIIDSFPERFEQALSLTPLHETERQAMRDAFWQNSRVFLHSYLLERRGGLFPPLRDMTNIFTEKDDFRPLMQIATKVFRKFAPGQFRTRESLLHQAALFCQYLDDWMDYFSDYSVQPNMLWALAKERHPEEFQKLSAWVTPRSAASLTAANGALFRLAPKTTREYLLKARLVFRQALLSQKSIPRFMFAYFFFRYLWRTLSGVRIHRHAPDLAPQNGGEKVGHSEVREKQAQSAFTGARLVKLDPLRNRRALITAGIGVSMVMLSILSFLYQHWVLGLMSLVPSAGILFLSMEIFFGLNRLGFYSAYRWVTSEREIPIGLISHLVVLRSFGGPPFAELHLDRNEHLWKRQPGETPEQRKYRSTKMIYQNLLELARALRDEDASLKGIVFIREKFHVLAKSAWRQKYEDMGYDFDPVVVRRLTPFYRRWLDRVFRAPTAIISRENLIKAIPLLEQYVQVLDERLRTISDPGKGADDSTARSEARSEMRVEELGEAALKGLMIFRHGPFKKSQQEYISRLAVKIENEMNWRGPGTWGFHSAEIKKLSLQLATNAMNIVAATDGSLEAIKALFREEGSLFDAALVASLQDMVNEEAAAKKIVDQFDLLAAAFLRDFEDYPEKDKVLRQEYSNVMNMLVLYRRGYNFLRDYLGEEGIRDGILKVAGQPVSPGILSNLAKLVISLDKEWDIVHQSVKVKQQYLTAVFSVAATGSRGFTLLKQAMELWKDEGVTWAGMTDELKKQYLIAVYAVSIRGPKALESMEAVLKLWKQEGVVFSELTPELQKQFFTAVYKVAMTGSAATDAMEEIFKAWKKEGVVWTEMSNVLKQQYMIAVYVVAMRGKPAVKAMLEVLELWRADGVLWRGLSDSSKRQFLVAVYEAAWPGKEGVQAMKEVMGMWAEIGATWRGIQEASLGEGKNRENYEALKNQYLVAVYNVAMKGKTSLKKMKAVLALWKKEGVAWNGLDEVMQKQFLVAVYRVAVGDPEGPEAMGEILEFWRGQGVTWAGLDPKLGQQFMRMVYNIAMRGKDAAAVLPQVTAFLREEGINWETLSMELKNQYLTLVYCAAMRGMAGLVLMKNIMALWKSEGVAWPTLDSEALQSQFLTAVSSVAIRGQESLDTMKDVLALWHEAGVGAFQELQLARRNFLVAVFEVSVQGKDALEAMKGILALWKKEGVVWGNLSNLSRIGYLTAVYNAAIEGEEGRVSTEAALELWRKNGVIWSDLGNEALQRRFMVAVYNTSMFGHSGVAIMEQALQMWRDEGVVWSGLPADQRGLFLITVYFASVSGVGSTAILEHSFRTIKEKFGPGQSLRFMRLISSWIRLGENSEKVDAMLGRIQKAPGDERGQLIEQTRLELGRRVFEKLREYASKKRKSVTTVALDEDVTPAEDPGDIQRSEVREKASRVEKAAAEARNYRRQVGDWESEGGATARGPQAPTINDRSEMRTEERFVDVTDLTLEALQNFRLMTERGSLDAAPVSMGLLTEPVEVPLRLPAPEGVGRRGFLRATGTVGVLGAALWALGGATTLAGQVRKPAVPAKPAPADAASQAMRAMNQIRYAASLEPLQFNDWNGTKGNAIATVLGELNSFIEQWKKMPKQGAAPEKLGEIHRVFFLALAKRINSGTKLPEGYGLDYVRAIARLIHKDLPQFFAAQGLAFNVKGTAVENLTVQTTRGGQVVRSQDYFYPTLAMPDKYFFVLKANARRDLKVPAQVLGDEKTPLVLVQPVQIRIGGGQVQFSPYAEQWREGQNNELGFADGTTAFLRADLIEQALKYDRASLGKIDLGFLAGDFSLRDIIQGVRVGEPTVSQGKKTVKVISYPVTDLSSAAGYAAMKLMTAVTRTLDKGKTVFDFGLWQLARYLETAKHEITHVNDSHGNLWRTIWQMSQPASDHRVAQEDTNQAEVLIEQNARLEALRKVPAVSLVGLLATVQTGGRPVTNSDKAQAGILDAVTRELNRDPARYGIVIDAGLKLGRAIQITAQFYRIVEKPDRVEALYAAVRKALAIDARAQALASKYASLDPSASSSGRSEMREEELSVGQGERLPQDIYSVEMPVREFMTALKLEETRIVRRFREASSGLYATEVEIAHLDGRPLAVKGPHVLRELFDFDRQRLHGKSARFYVLYDDENLPLAIFPKEGQAPADVREHYNEMEFLTYSFLDLTDYRTPYDLLRTFGHPGDRAKWKEHALSLGVLKEKVAAFKNYYEQVLLKNAGEFPMTGDVSVGQHPFIYSEFDAREKKIKSVSFGPEFFLSDHPDRHSSLSDFNYDTGEDVQARERIFLDSGNPRAVFIRFWSVFNYMSSSYADGPFRRHVYDTVRETVPAMHAGDVIGDLGTGPGVMTWLAWIAAGDRRDEFEYAAADINPLAAANAETNLKYILKVPHVSVTVHDNLVSPEKTRAFPKPLRVLIINAPAYGYKDPGEPTGNVTLFDFHDGGKPGYQFWDGLIDGLPLSMDRERSMMLAWNFTGDGAAQDDPLFGRFENIPGVSSVRWGRSLPGETTAHHTYIAQFGRPESPRSEARTGSSISEVDKGMLKEKQVVLTGAGGNIGSVLFDELLGKAKHVTPLLLPAEIEPYAGYGFENAHKATIKTTELPDPKIQKEMVAQNDVIFHLAMWGAAIGAEKLSDPLILPEFLYKNVLPTAIFVRAAENAPHKPRIVFASTMRVYDLMDLKEQLSLEESGLKLDPELEAWIAMAVEFFTSISDLTDKAQALERVQGFLREHAPSERYTKNPDALAKIVSERIIDRYSNGISLRLGNVYGPAYDPQKTSLNRRLVHRYFFQVLHGEKEIRFDRVPKNLIYVDDVAHAFIAAATADLGPLGGQRVINVGASTRHTGEEVARTIVRVAGAKIALVPETDSKEKPRLLMDTQRMKSVLGLDPAGFVTLEEGVRRTWTWMNQHPDVFTDTWSNRFFRSEAREDRRPLEKPIKTILVVDDRESALEALELLLNLDGFKVTAVSSGEAALQALNQGVPDAILTKVPMSGMTGPEWILEAVKMPGLERVPIVFMGDEVGDKILGELKEQHPVHLLKKPVRGDFLRPIFKNPEMYFLHWPRRSEMRGDHQAPFSFDEITDVYLDLDGVVLDTIGLNRKHAAYIYSMIFNQIADPSGFKPDPEALREGTAFYDQRLGESTEKNLKTLFNERKDLVFPGINDPAGYFLKLYETRRDEDLRSILQLPEQEVRQRLLMPGVMEFFEAAKDQGKRVRIISTSKKEFRLPIIQKTGLLKYFEDPEKDLVFVNTLDEKISVLAKALGDLPPEAKAIFVDDSSKAIDRAVRIKPEVRRQFWLVGMPATAKEAARSREIADHIVTSLSDLVKTPARSDIRDKVSREGKRSEVRTEENARDLEVLQGRLLEKNAALLNAIGMLDLKAIRARMTGTWKPPFFYSNFNLLFKELTALEKNMKKNRYADPERIRSAKEIADRIFAGFDSRPAYKGSVTDRKVLTPLRNRLNVWAGEAVAFQEIYNGWETSLYRYDPLRGKHDNQAIRGYIQKTTEVWTLAVRRLLDEIPAGYTGFRGIVETFPDLILEWSREPWNPPAAREKRPEYIEGYLKGWHKTERLESGELVDRIQAGSRDAIGPRHRRELFHLEEGLAFMIQAAKGLQFHQEEFVFEKAESVPSRSELRGPTAVARDQLAASNKAFSLDVPEFPRDAVVDAADSVDTIFSVSGIAFYLPKQVSVTVEGRQVILSGLEAAQGWVVGQMTQKVLMQAAASGISNERLAKVLETFQKAVPAGAALPSGTSLEGPRVHVHLTGLTENDRSELITHFTVVLGALVSLRGRLLMNIDTDDKTTQDISEKIRGLAKQEGITLAPDQLKIVSSRQEDPFLLKGTQKVDALVARNNGSFDQVAYRKGIGSRWVTEDAGDMKTLAAALTTVLYAALDKQWETDRFNIHKPSEYDHGTLLEAVLQAIQGYLQIRTAA
jgi:nucleoside-diphosphate-sugar epimerase/phosphoglycolate phosphatase-like HAD superfamily hydrolase/tRNA A-37 threonylcarbamoyl transferase component Bud32/SAM-dependent methyltransferase